MSKKLIKLGMVLIAIVCVLGMVYQVVPKNRLMHAYDMAKARMLYAMEGDGEQGGSGGVASSEESGPSKVEAEKFHFRKVEPDIPLEKIIQDKGIIPDDSFSLYVDIENRMLLFKYKEETLKKYRIACGSRTEAGDKEKEGDYRTPRGEFYICTQEVYRPSKPYLGSRWMLLSYPGIEVAEKGLEDQSITQEMYNSITDAYRNKTIPPQDTGLGSAIGIHGGALPRYPKDWTAGCIGMYDQDVEEIYDYVQVGTRVVIE